MSLILVLNLLSVWKGEMKKETNLLDPDNEDSDVAEQGELAPPECGTRHPPDLLPQAANAKLKPKLHDPNKGSDISDAKQGKSQLHRSVGYVTHLFPNRKPEGVQEANKQGEKEQEVEEPGLGMKRPSMVYS
jgi:hypothetical protein